MAVDYNTFYTRKKGAAYKDSQIEPYSHYEEPVDHKPGRLAGHTRIWGDAPLEVQKQVIDKLIAAAREAGMNARRAALLLATAKIESGFNPDAAAGTTSASSLGQFVDKTGKAYGLNDSNRFDTNANVKALLAHFLDNEALAKKRGKPDVWCYKYHHDGPTADYGGEGLATGKFAALADLYEKALDVGHTLNIVDPAGKAIADATIKVEQNGNSLVMKTNEHGALPAFLASPDLGPLTVHIQKLGNDFKELGQIAIDKLNSAWTIIAPKERIPIKTYVHAAPAAPVSAPHVHKVKSGETLSRIAREHGTTYQEIATLNHIAKPYLLYPDQVLKLPDSAAKTAAARAPANPPANPPVSAAPAGAAVVKEHRSADATHPEARVTRTAVSDRIAATIAYAMQHKGNQSIGKCLRYVKKALLAGGYFNTYPGVEHAKDFGPTLERAGFKNLLETTPGINLTGAPNGAVIIYRPVERQTRSNGGVISGHIEIKHDGGYVSDFNGLTPCYRTNPATLLSPVHKKYNVRFKVTGIWYKE